MDVANVFQIHGDYIGRCACFNSVLNLDWLLYHWRFQHKISLSTIQMEVSEDLSFGITHFYEMKMPFLQFAMESRYIDWIY